MTKLDAPAFAGAALTGRWRLFHTPARSGAANMAIDHALMARARRTGESVLRVYTWSAPTLSLGRHHLALGRIDQRVASELGVSLVRRARLAGVEIGAGAPSVIALEAEGGRLVAAQHHGAHIAVPPRGGDLVGEVEPARDGERIDRGIVHDDLGDVVGDRGGRAHALPVSDR